MTDQCGWQSTGINPTGDNQVDNPFQIRTSALYDTTRGLEVFNEGDDVFNRGHDVLSEGDDAFCRAFRVLSKGHYVFNRGLLIFIGGSDVLDEGFHVRMLSGTLLQTEECT